MVTGGCSSPWLRFVGYLKPYKKILAYLFIATFVIQILAWRRLSSSTSSMR
jgi:hypothetical protein